MSGPACSSAGISQFKLSWFDNNNALVAAHENMPKSIVISYEALIQGRPSVKKAFKKLGFNVDMNVIRKDEQTQKNSRIVFTADEQKLYKILQKLEKTAAADRLAAARSRAWKKRKRKNRGHRPARPARLCQPDLFQRQP